MTKKIFTIEFYTEEPKCVSGWSKPYVFWDEWLAYNYGREDGRRFRVNTYVKQSKNRKKVVGPLN